MIKFYRLLFVFVLIVSFGVQSAHSVEAANSYSYYLKVNRGTNVVTVYNSSGVPLTAFVCSTGAKTPNGTFHTMEKHRWWTLDGPCWGQYCTRITGHILFHSVWYNVNESPATLEYSEYNKLGTEASHGCVRLTTAASKWIYENCPSGTKVIIFSGTAADDPLGKPDFIHVKGAQGWDPTDPNPSNPYEYKDTTPVIKVSRKRQLFLLEILLRKTV